MDDNDEHVHQYMTPKLLRLQIEEFGLQQATVARLARVNEGNLSMFLAQRKQLGSEAQTNLFRVFEFCEATQDGIDVPVDFNSAAIEKRFREWLRSHRASEVIQTETA